MQYAVVHFVSKATPGESADLRFRSVRSPHCPNDVRDTDEEPDEEKGKCGSCAWGFYRMDSPDPQVGIDPTQLSLVPIMTDEAPAGYSSQCGKVMLYRDKEGRIGALREVHGVQRFFPGIVGNWAYERYLTNNPSLLGN